MPGTGQQFSVAQARALIPQVKTHAAEVVRLRADLAELTLDLRVRGTSERGGIPEVKAAEARLEEEIAWFTDQGIEVKGLTPFLIDFPSVLDGTSVRLCWLEGDPDLAWYHRTDLGFAGRRPLDP